MALYTTWCIPVLLYLIQLDSDNTSQNICRTKKENVLSFPISIYMVVWGFPKPLDRDINRNLICKKLWLCQNLSCSHVVCHTETSKKR